MISQFIIANVCGITAKFTWSKTGNCAPAVVAFTNTSTRGAGITYTWNFGLGAIVTATDYRVKEQLYTKPGQYVVKLKVTDGLSTDSTSAVITISQGPVAVFTAGPSGGCAPLRVKFTSVSVQGDSEIMTTLWDFRTGDQAEGVSVQHLYESPGLYNVLLKVTDSNGCSSQIESEKIITVVEKPEVDFAASDTFGCSPPLNVSFTNLSHGSSSLAFRWNFGNGMTSTEFSNSTVYDTAGSYSVSLMAADQYGCSDSLVKKSYINIGYRKGTMAVYDRKGNLINRSFLCDGLYRFVYSDPGLPTYTWTITDNDRTTTVSGRNTLDYQVSGSGRLTIKLVFGRGSFCRDSISVSYIKSYIKANFSLKDTLFCSVPLTLNLSNASMNADRVKWYLSDKFLSADKITSYNVTESDLPEETYAQLYSHELNLIRLPVKLVASNAGVCFDSLTLNITVAKPLARFMPDKVSGCVPLQVTLSDSSRSSLPIDLYTYRIGNDQVTSTAGIPVSYTITQPGDYYGTEIIRSGGCYDTSYMVRISAGARLMPDFTVLPSEVCNGGEISLHGQADPRVKMWRFSSPGIFDISLKSDPDTTISVYSEMTGYRDISLQAEYNGCLSEVVKKDIFNIKGPAGAVTGSFSCDSSLKYRFRHTVQPYTSLIWNIDTAVFTDIDSADYTFPGSGDYTVRLTASDLSSGCTLERSNIFKVRQVYSSFTLNDTVFCAGDSVLMDASSSRDYINNCYNEGFLWDFGDDSPPRRTFLKEYYHIYSGRGYDTISLVATGDNGCADMSAKVVYISRPAGEFISDLKNGCVPAMNVKFTNTSTDTTIVRWIWNFGDNTSDSTNSMSVTHLYTSENQRAFYPTLTVYDKYSCYSSYAIPTNLIAINSDFQASDNAICLGDRISFRLADVSNTILYWNYGDGTPSTTESDHTYNKTGGFTVSLAASKEGCQDTVTKLNYISVEKADASFIASDTVLNCYPATINFVHKNQPGSEAVEYLWRFDSHPLSDRSSESVKYTFTRPGSLLTQLTARTLNGCEATSSKNIKVNGPDAAISFTPDEICYNQAVTFRLDSLKDVTSWKWFFGDGTTSTANPVTHRYTSRGKIVPSVQLISPTCTATRIPDTLFISKVQALFKSSDSLYSHCYGTRINLVNSSREGSFWTWIIDGETVSNGYALNNVSFSKPGQHTVTLVAREPGGCSDTLSRKFTVNPLPSVKITGDSVICSGQNSVTLSVARNQGDIISWTPATGLDNSRAFIVKASPPVTTKYTAKITSLYGCSESSEKTVYVDEMFDMKRIPEGDTSIYIGQKIQLQVTAADSNVKFVWTPDYNISCTKCNNPQVNPLENTVYRVRISNGCFDLTVDFGIEVIRDFYLEAPSAFTPNGDSNNDIFKFESKNIVEIDLKIFNRWGEIVFSTSDVNRGWDGNVNGHPQNIDTYKYTIRAKTIHGFEFMKRGEVLLLR